MLELRWINQGRDGYIYSGRWLFLWERCGGATGHGMGRGSGGSPAGWGAVKKSQQRFSLRVSLDVSVPLYRFY